MTDLQTKTAQFIKKFAQTALFRNTISIKKIKENTLPLIQVANMQKEICFIVDSDDFLGNNAIEVLNEKI